MKKTGKTNVMVKILVAVMAAAMMIGTAAGCQGSKSAGQDSEVSVESSVTAVPESQPSVVASLSSGETSNSKYIDLKTVAEDKFELILTGKDTVEGKYEEVFVLVDDGSLNGYVAIYITEEQNGKKVSCGVLQGSVTEKKDTDNADGTHTIAFTVKDEHGMSEEMTLTGTADGDDFTMTFKSVEYIMQLKKADTAAGLTLIDEQLKILEENNPTANAYADSDAATIDCVCKNYYSEVVAGTVNETERANVKSDTLPANGASIEERKAAADKCTIQGALEYAGIDDIGMQDRLSEMAATEGGTIYSKKNTSVQADRAVTPETTLGDLYQIANEVAEQADEKAQDAYAADAIDAACKMYMAAIEADTLDEEGVKAVTADTLPAAGAPIEERHAALLNCTIKGALEYSSLDVADFDFSKFAVDENGTIISKNQDTYGSMLDTITENTTFGEIYAAAMEQISHVSTKAEDTSNAALIDSACKFYYSSIVSGSILDDEFAVNVKSDTLPDKNATEDERTAAALKCTIQGALEYHGIADVAFNFSKYAMEADGTIVAKSEEAEGELKDITPATTFEDLGYANMADAE